MRQYFFLQIGHHEFNVAKLVGKVPHDSHKLVMHPNINDGCLRASTSATRPRLTRDLLRGAQAPPKSAETTPPVAFSASACPMPTLHIAAGAHFTINIKSNVQTRAP